jgi:hypothetical protein
MSLPHPDSAARFRDHLVRILDYLNAHFDRRIEYSEDDPFAFMTLAFLSKQRTHAQTILSLGNSRDSLLVARSMLEGLMLLLWTERKVEERAPQWRAFALVHDWRLFQRLKSQGDPFDQAKLDETELRLRGYRSLVFRKGALKDLSAGKPLPADPYRNHWPSVTLEDIFNELGQPLLYGGLYSYFCAYHHWAITGFIGSLRRSQSSVGYTALNQDDGVMALVIAISCLTQTAQITNTVVPFCPEEELQQLSETAMKVYREATA